MSKSVIIWVMVLCLTGSPCQGSDNRAELSSLEDGFHYLYNFDFPDAQHEFAAWQSLHPDDPVGFVAEASGSIVDEFDRFPPHTNSLISVCSNCPDLPAARCTRKKWSRGVSESGTILVHDVTSTDQN